MIRRIPEHEELMRNISGKNTGESGNLTVRQIGLLYEHDLLSLPRFQRALKEDDNATRNLRRNLIKSFLEGRYIDFIKLDVNQGITKKLNLDSRTQTEFDDSPQGSKLVISDGQHRISELMYTFVEGGRWALKIPKGIKLRNVDLNYQKAEFFNQVDIVGVHEMVDSTHFKVCLSSLLSEHSVLKSVLEESMESEFTDRIADILIKTVSRPIGYVFIQSFDEQDQFQTLREQNTNIKEFNKDDLFYTTLSSYGINIDKILKQMKKEQPLFAKYIKGIDKLLMIVSVLYNHQIGMRLSGNKGFNMVESIEKELVPKEYLAENFESILNKVEKILRSLVDNRFYRSDLPAGTNLSFKQTALVPYISYLIIKGGLSKLTVDELDYFKKHYFSSAIAKGKGVNSTHQNLPDVYDLLDLNEKKLDDKINAAHSKDFTNETHYNVLLFLNYLQEPVDWKNGVKIGMETNDLHHVFPTNFLEKVGVGRGYTSDSVLNTTMIPASINRSIKANSPATYMTDLREELPSADEFMRTHRIEPAFLINEKYEDFITDRNIRIKQDIKDFLEIL